MDLRSFLLFAVAFALATVGCDDSRATDPGPPQAAVPTEAPPAPTHEASEAGPDWCVGHGVPESKCTKCNPELVPRFEAAGDWCDEHGFPESVCPVCNPQAPPAGAEVAALEARIVRLRSTELEAAAGIETVPARRSEAAATIGCTARIAFDSDRVADVRAIVPGLVRGIDVELGAQVEAGAPLFELESTRVGEIQGSIRAARERVRAAKAHLTRQEDLRRSGITSARSVELARKELAEASAEARTAGATLRMAGARRSGASGRYALTAPIAGTVVRRPAVLGTLASEDTSLATIADTSVMWALCDIAERDAGDVALGQSMSVSIEGAGDEPVAGTVTWIAPEVDPRTRTVTARADVPNPDGRLFANMFARARITAASPQSAVSVPRAAVQRVGDLEVVFVRRSAGVYEPRVVKRHAGEDPVLVEGDVTEGDEVVTTGAVLLRTEVMPGSIGAGCCEEVPGDE